MSISNKITPRSVIKLKTMLLVTTVFLLLAAVSVLLIDEDAESIPNCEVEDIATLDDANFNVWVDAHRAKMQSFELPYSKERVELALKHFFEDNCGVTLLKRNQQWISKGDCKGIYFNVMETARGKTLCVINYKDQGRSVFVNPESEIKNIILLSQRNNDNTSDIIYRKITKYSDLQDELELKIEELDGKKELSKEEKELYSQMTLKLAHYKESIVELNQQYQNLVAEGLVSINQ